MTMFLFDIPIDLLMSMFVFDCWYGIGELALLDSALTSSQHRDQYQEVLRQTPVNLYHRRNLSSGSDYRWATLKNMKIGGLSFDDCAYPEKFISKHINNLKKFEFESGYEWELNKTIRLAQRCTVLECLALDAMIPKHKFNTFKYLVANIPLQNHLRSLSLRMFFVNHEFLVNVSSICIHLAALSIISCNFPPLNRMIDDVAFRRLESLCFIENNRSPKRYSGVLKGIIKGASHSLLSLECDMDVSGVLLQCDLVRRLKVTDCGLDLSTLLCKFVRLTKLHITNSRLGKDFVGALTSNGQCLKQLDMFSCKGALNGFFIHALTRLPVLEILAINSVTSGWEVPLLETLATFNRLRSIDYNGELVDAEEDDLLAVVRNNPCLAYFLFPRYSKSADRVLDLVAERGRICSLDLPSAVVSNISVMKLFQSCRRLGFATLQGCIDTSDTTLHSIMGLKDAFDVSLSIGSISAAGLDVLACHWRPPLQSCLKLYCAPEPDMNRRLGEDAWVKMDWSLRNLRRQWDGRASVVCDLENLRAPVHDAPDANLTDYV